MKNQTQQCQLRWQSSTKVLPKSQELQSWLIEPGSLTQRLRSISLNFKVHVLNENWQSSSKDEMKLLQDSELEQAWVRETILCDGNKTLIFARSIFPKATLAGRGEILKTLGNRSLGDFLFTDPDWHRDPFEINYLQPQDFFCSHLATIISYPKQPFWARCSRFYFFGQPLLITEAFLPDLMEIIVNNINTKFP